MADEPDSESLTTYLQDQGLEDVTYWLPKFKAVGMKNKKLLTHIKGNQEAYDQLIKHARKNNFVEIAALTKILEIDPKKRKQELDNRAKVAQQQLQELDQSTSELSSQQGQRVQKLHDQAANKLQVSFNPSSEFKDQLTAQHEQILQGGGHVQARNWLDDRSVLMKASEGRALQGVLLTKHLEDQLKRRSRLLKVPDSVTLSNGSAVDDKYVHFTSTHQEEEFTKKLKVLGSGFALSASIPVYGSLAIGGGVSKNTKSETEQTHTKTQTEVYLSTVGYCTVHTQSYTFENTDFVLSVDAKQEVMDILRIFQQQGPTSENVQTRCEMFFETYGSHVNQGPLAFGGKFGYICSSSGFCTTETKTLKQTQTDSIKVQLGITAFGIGASGEKTKEETTGSSEGTNTKTSTTKTTLRRSGFGGPPEASDVSKWREGLVANNSTWAIIDRGEKLKAVWDIIAMNHKKELGEVSEILRKAWEKMTGLKSELRIQETLSYDPQAVLEEVKRWNTQELTNRQIADNLRYLLNVKRDIMKVVANRNYWTKEYLTGQSLQDFFMSRIVTHTFQPVSDAESIKSLMKQLLEKEDLCQLTSRDFPDIEQLSQWLFAQSKLSEASTTPTDCADFKSFDEYLEKKVNDEYLSGCGPQAARIVNPSLSSDISVVLHYLRSHYSNKYEDVLITLLVHQFQKQSHDNLIILKPMSLNDVVRLRQLFSEKVATFHELAKKKNPLCLQAFLFTVAVDVCDPSNVVQVLQQVEEKLGKVDEPLKEKIHAYIHYPTKVDIRRLLQTFMASGHMPPSCQRALSVSGDHSLRKVLETVTREQMMERNIQPDITPFENNPHAHDLFQKLGLCDRYYSKFKLQDALCIRPEILQLSQGERLPKDLKQLPLLVLHKIMAYDIFCRTVLMPQQDGSNVESDDSSGGETSDETDNEEYDNETLKQSPMAVVSFDQNQISPVDSLLALLLCSDNFLRHDLFSRLAKCQLAVPFILPDPFTKELIVPLWAMRSVVMQWKCIETLPVGSKVVEYDLPLIDFGMPIVSFIRLGSHNPSGTSKSKLLNDVITDSTKYPFFHRDCHGGRIKLQVGKGLVDMSWYLPSGRKTDTFQYPIAFANLHGDASCSELSHQVQFLSRISSMCFALISKKEQSLDDKAIKMLGTFSSSAGGLTILSDVEKVPKALKRDGIKMYVIKLSDRNADERKCTIRQRITKKLKPDDKCKSIRERCSADILIESNIRSDEDSVGFKQGSDLAKDVMQLITGFDDKQLSQKQAFLPLQGHTLWQAWASKDKESYRQDHRGNKKVEEYAAFVLGEKNYIRQQQMVYVQSLTPVMESFMTSLFEVSGPFNRALRNCFLQSLKLGLNELSREKIHALQYRYQTARKKLAEAQARIKTHEPTSTINVSITNCKEEMETLKKDIVNASLGLEHLFRELGQIYEAALINQESSTYRDKLSRLPKVAAELLIDGYPLELMDGDAAHVPVQWVSAVMKEVVDILEDPKVYVLSVLGLQSTGKSTMLNTVFGLQFNVSAGRCTRGAFMQLIPLDDDLSTQTQCHYVLVVDTEGLRAPELDFLKSQKHDNELATFVIGLANATLINIYGEVPGDMDDILQTSVHAFLRMNRVKLNPSCHFVHQNAGASLKSELGRHNFTQKLNKFTVDAAIEENCKGRYETFNDVIAFDDQRNVHHFPGLWEGDPPMAPINHGYSDRAQILKCNITGILVETTSQHSVMPHSTGAGDLCLSLFASKLCDLWKALLKENFVFSFRNTLEITAYNSLETQYGLLESEFRGKMRQWRDGVKNLIETAKTSESVAALVDEKCSELHRFVNEQHEDLKKKMKAFFDTSKQRELLIQWKASFENKLERLSQELKEDAMSHCRRLGSSKQAISEVDRNMKDYVDKVKAKAQEVIAALKQERKKLYNNLQNKRLQNSQLQSLLEQNLFTHDTVLKYKSQNLLTDEEAEEIEQTLDQCGGSLHDKDLQSILYSIPAEQARLILKQGRLNRDRLKVLFDAHWIKLSSIPFVPLKQTSVEVAVQTRLIDFVRKLEGQLIDKIKQRGLTEAPLELFVEENTHYEKIKKGNVAVRVLKWVYDKYRELRDIDDPIKINAQVITNMVMEKTEGYLEEECVADGDADFHEDHVTELLKLLDKAITDLSTQFGDSFVFLPDYRLDVYLTACQYAVGKFKKMAAAFREKHDPQLWLVTHVKGPLFTIFENQYNETEAEEANASTLCAYLKVPLREKVKNTIGRTMATQMEFAEPHFKSKMALKFKILSDLREEDNFYQYMLHVKNVEKSYKNWIRRYVVQYCDELEPRSESRMQLTAKKEVTQFIEIVKDRVLEIDEKNTRQWLTLFCEDDVLRREFGIAFEVDDILIDDKEMNLENFKSQIMSGLQELETTLHTSFSNITCECKRVNEKPYNLLRQLAGCTAQCPFCNEQCDWMKHDVKDKKHRIAVHRPSCLKGFKDHITREMVTTICPAAVDGNSKFRNCYTDHQWHPYRDYQEIYPDWSIEPDPTCEDSLYWMSFVSRYNEKIAEEFDVKPALVPAQWSQFQWEEIREKMKKQHYL